MFFFLEFTHVKDPALILSGKTPTLKIAFVGQKFTVGSIVVAVFVVSACQTSKQELLYPLKNQRQ